MSMLTSAAINGIMLLVVYWAMKCVTYFVPRRAGRMAAVFLYIGCFFLINMIIFIGDLVNLPPTLAAFMLAVLTCCKGTRHHRVSVALVFSAIAFAINALVDCYLMRFSMFGLKFRYLPWILLFLYLRKKPALATEGMPRASWNLVALLTLSPLCTTLIVVLLSDINTGTTLVNALLLLVSFFSACGILWVITVLSNQCGLERAQALYQVNKIYYEQLERDQFFVRRLRHDMANHLQVLTDLPDDERQTYMASLLQTDALRETLRYCDNNTVNSVLRAKEAKLNELEIETDIAVSLPAQLCVKPVDLCAIFSNSIDNAIEACALLPADRRHITMHARADKGMLMLLVKNPIASAPIQRSGRYMTTKADPIAHGIGLASIHEIITRYGGTAKIQPVEHNFELLLSIPLAAAREADPT